MSKILISLISDQSIPNVLFIKQMPDVDFHILVTTQRMETDGKTDYVIKGGNLSSNQYTKVIVIEDSLTDIKAKLEALNLNSSAKYILNLTGGTKIMSIGVNRFFEDFDHESYYIAIGKNTFKRIFPRDDDREYAFTHQLSLEEYLNAYGFRIEKSGLPTWATANVANTCYAKFNNLPYRFIPVIKALRTWQQRNRTSNLLLTNLLNELQLIPNLIQYLDFHPQNSSELSVDEIQFIISGWWEAVVFYRLKKDLNLSDIAITSNCHIKFKRAPNELDIALVKNNKLYVVECKTGFEQYRFMDAFNEAIYKLAAVRRDMGIRITGYVFILDKKLRENGSIKQQFLDRAETMDTTLIDKVILNNLTEWQTILNKIN
jgi:Domain of unknown function (DUF1887)